MRRHHNKTRTGCKSCKNRRIKALTASQCDEGKPTCGNCTRRSLRCSFADSIPAAGGPSIHPTPESNSGENIPDGLNNTGSFPFEFTLQDLELLHLWCTKTCLTISKKATHRSLWHDDIPKYAFTSADFLLRGILAISALHQAYLLHEETGSTAADERYLAIAARHQNLGLSGLRDAIDNVTRENSGPILAFNTFVFIFTCSSSRMERTLYKYFTGSHPDSAPHWIKIMHGMRVLSPNWKWVEESPMGILLPRHDWQSNIELETPEEIEMDACLAKLADIWTSEDMASNDPSSNVTRSASLTRNLENLRGAYMLSSHYSRMIELQQSQDTVEEQKHLFNSSVLTWMHFLDETFVEMLDRQDTATLVLFAHYAILLLKMFEVCESWFMKGVGEEIIQAIAEHLGEKRHLISWPLDTLASHQDKCT